MWKKRVLKNLSKYTTIYDNPNKHTQNTVTREKKTQNMIPWKMWIEKNKRVFNQPNNIQKQKNSKIEFDSPSENTKHSSMILNAIIKNSLAHANNDQ